MVRKGLATHDLNEVITYVKLYSFKHNNAFTFSHCLHNIYFLRFTMFLCRLVFLYVTCLCYIRLYAFDSLALCFFLICSSILILNSRFVVQWLGMYNVIFAI